PQGASQSIHAALRRYSHPIALPPRRRCRRPGCGLTQGTNEMSDNRQLKLGAFIMATGHHVSAWRHPDSQADAGLNIDHYKQLAQTAERGKFDLVFVADSPAGWERAK